MIARGARGRSAASFLAPAAPVLSCCIVPSEYQAAVIDALTPQCVNVPFALEREGVSTVHQSNNVILPNDS